MARWLRFVVDAENVHCCMQDATAKACHYWEGHLSEEQQDMFRNRDPWGPEIAGAPCHTGRRRFIDALERAGVTGSDCPYTGWIWVETDSEAMAVRLVRALVADNVIARREGNMFCLAAERFDGARQWPRVVRVLTNHCGTGRRGSRCESESDIRWSCALVPFLLAVNRRVDRHCVQKRMANRKR